MVKLMLSFLQLSLLFGSVMLVHSVDPNDYIWFNFGTTTTIQPYTDSYKEVILPCETRIGRCIYTFTLLPPLWVGLEDKLLIPTSDVYRVGNYAVQVTVSELTGQTLNFNLILEAGNGRVTTYDRDQFFGNNNYNTDAPTTPNNTNSNINTGSSYFRSFPPLEEVSQTFQEGDAYNMNILVSNLLNKNESCPVHLSYLNNVQGILQDQVFQKEGLIKVKGTEFDVKFKQITVLQDQQQKLAIELDPQSRRQKLQKKIRDLNGSRTSIYLNYNRYNIITNSYLNRIKKDVNYQQTGSEEDPVKEAELAAINDRLLYLEIRKVQLEEAISIKKLSSILSEQALSNILHQTLQEQYKYYSELAILEKVKFQDLDYDINSLIISLNARTNSLQSLNNQISDIQAQIEQLRQSPTSSALSSLDREQQILVSSEINLENKIQNLKATCRRT